MQAAFVDIGLDRTGFLYVDDIDISMSMTQLSQPEVSPSIIDAVKKNTATHLAIEDLLKEGQTILVQITKEPIGSKGARLNCHITLPCPQLGVY
ncbi:ribonuclease, partial [Desulfobulbus sp. US1]|nr:ribonuclease [Desulfobulbus sp. US1]